MTVAGHTMYFAYDAAGVPMALTYDGATYYYITNLQGDVIAILDSTGTEVVRYAYDAWGNLISTTGTMEATLGFYNPLRYRGYVYDPETGLYYLQSRYYNPEMGRFINADGFTSTGQGVIGNNAFAYCGNNPINRVDSTGNRWDAIGEIIPAIWEGITTIAGNIFGASCSTSATISESEIQIIPDPAPITMTSGTITSQTISQTGDSSKPISVYADYDVTDPVLSATAGLNVNVFNFTLNTCLGLENIGISGSLNDQNVANTLGLKVDLSKLKVGIEGTTAVQWDHVTETAYTNFSVSGWAIAMFIIFYFTGQVIESPQYLYQ